MKTKLLLSAFFCFALLVIALRSATQDPSPKTAPTSPGTTAAIPADQLEAENAAREAKAQALKAQREAERVSRLWHRDESTDDMTGKPTVSVSARSMHSFELEFPHRGMHYGHLTVRRHPRYGLDVIVSVEAGQLICDYENCRILVRFDDKKPTSFAVSEAADRSSKTWFINDTSRFLKSLERANLVAAELRFYRQGHRTLKFETTGFKRP